MHKKTWEQKSCNFASQTMHFIAWKKTLEKKQPKPVYYVYSITWEQKSCNEGCMLKQPLVTEKRHIGAKLFLKSHLEKFHKFTISRDPYFIEFLSYPSINMRPVKP